MMGNTPIQGITRRTLALSAWSVPVIAMVEAAPAFAASGGTDLTVSIDVTPTAIALDTPTPSTMTLTLTNLGPGATTGAVSITVSALHGFDTYGSITLSDTANWSFSQSFPTWTFVHSGIIPAGSSVTLTVTYVITATMWLDMPQQIVYQATLTATNAIDDGVLTNDTDVAYVGWVPSPS